MRGGTDPNHLRAIHGPRFSLEAENCARRALNVALKRAHKQKRQSKRLSPPTPDPISAKH